MRVIIVEERIVSLVSLWVSLAILGVSFFGGVTSLRVCFATGVLTLAGAFGADFFGAAFFCTGFFDTVTGVTAFFVVDPELVEGVAGFVVFFVTVFLAGADFLTGFFATAGAGDATTLFGATFFLGAAFFFGEDFTIGKN